MEQYQTLTMDCDNDIADLKQFVDKYWTFQFLAGLKQEFDQEAKSYAKTKRHY